MRRLRLIACLMVVGLAGLLSLSLVPGAVDAIAAETSAATSAFTNAAASVTGVSSASTGGVAPTTSAATDATSSTTAAASTAAATASTAGDAEASVLSVEDDEEIQPMATAVCQIMRSGAVYASYDTLAAAMAAVQDGDTVEMLVASYAVDSQVTVPAKTVTLTTASSVGSVCTFYRNYSGNSLIATTSGTNLTMTNVTVDGDRAGTLSGSARSSSANGGLVSVTSASTFVMGSGCTLQNSYATAQGGAVYLDSRSTMTMVDGSLGQNCLSTGHGGFLFQKTGSSFTATGGALNDNGNTASYLQSGGAIMQDPASGTSNITTTLTGTFSATGNYTTANGSFIHGAYTSSCTIIISGSASITGNKNYETAYAGGAIYPYGATVQLSGSPTVTGNSNTSSSTTMNIYAANTSKVKVTGDLAGGEVGIYVGTDAMKDSGEQFATSTATATTVSGLYHLTNDLTTGLVGLPGTGTAVVGGDGTCQIIRSGALQGFYATLAQACAAAEAGDNIEVYKSHVVDSTATLASSASGVTIKTAPTGTPTATGAHVFVPATGETTTAAVARASSLTTTALLKTDAAGTTVDNLVVSGGGVSSSAPCVTSTVGLALKNVTVSGCVNTSGTGAVDVASGEFTVNGTVSITGNTNASGNPNNVFIATAAGVVGIGDMLSSSSIGVTVSSAAEHVAFHDFAKASTEALATAAVGQFSDDRVPSLTIGANVTVASVSHSTYLYFEPPTAFSFTKVSADDATDGLSGATFSVYQYIGSGTPDTSTYVDFSGTVPTGWQLVNSYTSVTDGVVKTEDLPDGYFRIVETAAPTYYACPTGQWQVKVDSTAADPGKFTFTTIKNGAIATPDFNVAADGTITLPNNRSDGGLTISNTTVGDYADLTKAFEYEVSLPTGTYTGTIYDAGGIPTGAMLSFDERGASQFKLSGGQYVIIDGMAAGAQYSVTCYDPAASYDGSGTTYTSTAVVGGKGTGTPVSDIENKLSVTSTAPAGMTTVAVTNTRASVPVTGVNVGATSPWLLLGGIAVGGAAALLLARRLSRRA
ncbi:MAG: prealbumin-like fold domain-containing protein [Atopobiaceae bacterium]|nr:prealbumin-like fold domain-containing protein [Atopobiaceae bacterium]